MASQWPSQIDNFGHVTGTESTNHPNDAGLTHAAVHNLLADAVTKLETNLQNSGASHYASLTGIGQTTTPGGLTQTGSFTINDTTGDGLNITTNGAVTINSTFVDIESTGGIRQITTGGSDGITLWDKVGGGIVIEEDGDFYGIVIVAAGAHGEVLIRSDGSGPVALDTTGGSGSVLLESLGGISVSDNSTLGITILEQGDSGILIESTGTGILSGVTITNTGHNGISITDNSSVGMFVTEDGTGPLKISSTSSLNLVNTGAGGIGLFTSSAGIALYTGTSSFSPLNAGITIRDNAGNGITLESISTIPLQLLLGPIPGDILLFTSVASPQGVITANASGDFCITTEPALYQATGAGNSHWTQVGAGQLPSYADNSSGGISLTENGTGGIDLYNAGITQFRIRSAGTVEVDADNGINLSSINGAITTSSQTGTTFTDHGSSGITLTAHLGQINLDAATNNINVTGGVITLAGASGIGLYDTNSVGITLSTVTGGGNITVSGGSGNVYLQTNSGTVDLQSQGGIILAESSISGISIVQNLGGNIRLTQSSTGGIYLNGNGGSGGSGIQVGDLNDKVGFLHAPPVVKQTATGSKAGNAALASVIAALVTYGLLTDSTT